MAVLRKVIKATSNLGRHGQQRWWLDLECGHAELTRQPVWVGGLFECGVCTAKANKEPPEAAEREE
jgi:hypothetical protein